MTASDDFVLLLSLAALAVGPLAYQVARTGGGYLLAALDGFVYAAIGGLVLIHIVPESIALGGWLAVIGGAIGLLVPSMVEHRLGRVAGQAHAVALILGLTAIGLHAFLDGLALTAHETASDSHGHMLPMAVILHRLPVGLTVWFLLRPLYGIGAALSCLGLIGVATAVGYASGGTVQALMESEARGVFQALVAGSLLHVVIHRSYPISGVSTDAGRQRWQAGLGALAGLALLWSITGHDEIGGLWPGAEEAGRVFVNLALQSAPALLLAYVAAGVVYGMLPKASFGWMGRGSEFSQSLRGVGFGLPLPVCSCGVVPLYRSLLVQGVPATAGMAFLVATPELSLDALLISIPLLGGEFTMVRLIGAVVVALAIGWGLGRFATLLPSVSVAEQSDGGTESAGSLRKIASGTVEVLDKTAPWILVGLAVAAAVEPILGSGWVEAIAGGFEVELFALLGMPAYVCASGATPLVAVLLAKGVSPGAALAFLLTGPATNITTFGVLTQLHGRRIALAFGACMTLLAVGLGRIVNAAFDFEDGFPALAHEHEMGAGLAEVCLASLALLFVFTFLRKGPRGFVGELFDMEVQETGHCHDGDAAADVDDCCQEADAGDPGLTPATPIAVLRQEPGSGH